MVFTFQNTTEYKFIFKKISFISEQIIADKINPTGGMIIRTLKA